MKLLRRTTIIESKEDGTITQKPELKAEPVMQQDFAGALADKESNEEAAKKALEGTENQKNAEEVKKELESHKTPAPKPIKLKPYTEARDVRREDIGELIRECNKAGRVFKIKRNTPEKLEEGFRFIYEEFERDLPDCYFVAHSDDDANNDNGYFDTEEEAVEYAKANPDTICCVFKVCGNEEEKVWEKANESCKEGQEEECPKCHKHPCECEKKELNEEANSHFGYYGNETVAKYREFLNDALEVLEDFEDDDEVVLHSNTYRIDVPFIGTYGGYVEVNHPVKENEEEWESLNEAELTEADEKLNLKKYGFVRAPEEDFSDDGARFTCYWYDPEGKGDQRIRLSKHIGHYSNGKEVFLAARYNAPETGRYKSWDDLNGVSIETAVEGLPKLKADIDKFLETIDEFNTVRHLTDDEIKELVDEINFLKERAGLGEYEAQKRAFINKGIVEETIPYEDKRKLSDALRNARPYDKEKLLKDVKEMIKDVIKEMTSYPGYNYRRNGEFHSAKGIEEAVRSCMWRISNYPDEIKEKVVQHIIGKLKELHDFKVESLEEDISGKIIDRIANEIIDELEKEGLVEGLLNKLNEDLEDEVPSVTVEEPVVQETETEIVPESNPDEEIEIDNIETFVPVGEPATKTFTSIKDAGEGAMYAFKDTMKDIYGLTMKLGELQKLFSDSSDWLLNLLGLDEPKDDVISTEDLPQVVEPVEPVVVDEIEDVKPVVFNGEPLDINGFDDPEPIEYDEDDLF